MPAEIRHILFRPSEVVTAIRNHRARMNNALPPGTISKCGVVEDAGGVRFIMTIDADDPAVRPPQKTVIIDGPGLAAALILHCRDKRIPLPSDSQKELRKAHGDLMLVVTRNPSQQALPKLAVV